MAVANTIEQLRKQNSNEIEQSKSYSVSPHMLKEEDGFNVRDYDDPETEAHIEQLTEAYMQGKWVPPLIVKTVDGELLVRDGHCRRRAIYRAIEKGVEIRRVDVIEHSGDEIDQMALLLTSNAGKALTQLQKAAVYQKMKNHGLNEDEIGERLGYTGQHVRQMLSLISLPTRMKEQINKGMINPTYALELYREQGKAAADTIDKAYKAMQDKMPKVGDGKEQKPPKVTRKHVSKQRRLPPAVLSSLRGTMSSLAPMLAAMEVDESQEQISLTMDRDLFMQLREDALKIQKSDMKEDEKDAKAKAKADAEQEASQETLEASSNTPDEATAAAAAAAVPVTENPVPATEQVTAPEEKEEPSAVEALASLNDLPSVDEPAAETEVEEAATGDEYTLHSEQDTTASSEEAQDSTQDLLGQLGTLTKTFAQNEEEQADEEIDEPRVVRDEDEEAFGMHNTPDYF